MVLHEINMFNKEGFQLGSPFGRFNVLSFLDINFRHDIVMTACFLSCHQAILFSICVPRGSRYIFVALDLSYDIDTILCFFVNLYRI